MERRPTDIQLLDKLEGWQHLESVRCNFETHNWRGQFGACFVQVGRSSWCQSAGLVSLRWISPLNCGPEYQLGQRCTADWGGCVIGGIGKPRGQDAPAVTFPESI